MGTSRRNNSRNGCRSKTVRTLLGPIEVEVPRDRWGTFDPITVGKWQREVVGIDRLLLPLAAKHAPHLEVVALLRQVYPAHTSDGTLARIVATVRAHLTSWHERPFETTYPVLQVHRSAVRATNGRVVGFPVVSVLGLSAPARDVAQRRELLSVHAVPAGGSGEQWYDVLRDLRNRGLGGVRCVLGEGSTMLTNAVAGVWPGARALSPEGGPRSLLAS